MPAKNQKKRRTRLTPTRTSEVLDVKMAAELLTVSADTVYDLFKHGELPGRKVGRKWITTRNALLRWIESSSENNILAKAIERGDRHIITTALKSGNFYHNLLIYITNTRQRVNLCGGLGSWDETLLGYSPH
jgi:excisionase family DNA binding protein